MVDRASLAYSALRIGEGSKVRFSRLGGKAGERINACRTKHSSTLNLSGLNLSSVPPAVFQLTWLTELLLQENSIAELSGDLANLIELERLDVSSNTGLVVSPAIGHLTALRTLHAHGVVDRQVAPHPLPAEVGRCERLEVLNIGAMKLGRVPPWLEGLGGLRELYLWDNELTELPESLLAGMPRLELLNLRRNHLRSLPRSIGSLRQLRRLVADRNPLESLPDSIGNLGSLQVGEFGHTKLSTLPSSVSGWHALEILDLNNDSQFGVTVMGEDGDYRLSTFPYPSSESDPPDAPSGTVQTLPRELDTLPRLRYLILNGNPGLGLPNELLDSAPAEILAYLARTTQDSRPLNEAKLVVLGWGGAGKTSIVNRLVRNVFVEGEPRTEGIAVTAWPIELPDESRATLNIWDFGGQEIMHATHQFFLTTRSVYLLVLNGRNGSADTDAEYWLKVIESFAPNVPVVIALNQIERDPFDLDETGIRLRYPNIRSVVRTDCASGLGLDTLRQRILAATDHLPDLRVQFPTAWVQIKDRLSGMADDYLTFDRYRELCAGLGERDPAEQEHLATYLHCLGIALNYRDDPRLRDTHVLNPHWVTEGIYAILNSRNISARAGELRLNQLGAVLDRRRYPAERHLFLLDLMRKFDLCFTYPDDNTTWLVPELLPKQQPDSVADLLADDDLRFDYRYPIVPEGLLPRFIARSHVHSTGSARWRNGVVLRWEDNHAVVMSDASRQAISISVGGTARSRRRLLAVIRADFDALHSSYRFPIRAEIPVTIGPHRLAVEYEKLVAAERAGMPTLQEYTDGHFVDIVVRRLLDGVDLASAGDLRARQGSAARVFVSYSHRDERHREHLDAQLKVLRMSGLVHEWHDRRIEPGDHWRGEIARELERADIMVCLVTPDFLASEYCMDVELRQALQRHASGSCRVIPVIVRDCMWDRTPLADLQASPRDGKPIDSAPHRDAAWREVGEAIGRAADRQTLQR